MGTVLNSILLKLLNIKQCKLDNIVLNQAKHWCICWLPVIASNVLMYTWNNGFALFLRQQKNDSVMFISNQS